MAISWSLNAGVVTATITVDVTDLQGGPGDRKYKNATVIQRAQAQLALLQAALQNNDAALDAQVTTLSAQVAAVKASRVPPVL